MRRNIIIILVAALLMTAGCARYACKHTIGGIQCENMHTVYEQKVLSGPEISNQSTGSGHFTEKVPLKQRDHKTVTNVDYRTAVVRQMANEETRPIRVPTMVIRIWVAPWEDMQGDLHTPGYVYSEISDLRGRWLFGERNVEELAQNPTAYRRQAEIAAPVANAEKSAVKRSGIFDGKINREPKGGKPPIPGQQTKDPILKLKK